MPASQLDPDGHRLYTGTPKPASVLYCPYFNKPLFLLDSEKIKFSPIQPTQPRLVIFLVTSVLRLSLISCMYST